MSDAFDPTSAVAQLAFEAARELLSARVDPDTALIEATMLRVFEEIGQHGPSYIRYLVTAQLHLAYLGVHFVVAVEAGAPPGVPFEMENDAYLAATWDVARRLIAASIKNGGTS